MLQNGVKLSVRIWLILIIFINTSPASANFSVKTPKALDFSPDLTPFTAILSKPLKKGDRFQVQTGGRFLAFQLEVTGDVEITEIGGRFKTIDRSAKFLLKNSDGETLSKDVRYVTYSKANLLNEGSITNANCRRINNDNMIRMLCDNDMAGTGYISKIIAKTNLGQIIISLTPYTSPQPYVSIKGNFDAKSADISVELARNAFVFDTAQAKTAQSQTNTGYSGTTLEIWTKKIQNNPIAAGLILLTTIIVAAASVFSALRTIFGYKK